MISLVELLMIVGLATVTSVGASHGLSLIRQSRGGRTPHRPQPDQDDGAGRPEAGMWHTPRRDRRYRLRCQVEYRHEANPATGMALDISKQGWRVMGERPMSKGTVLSLRVCLPGQSTPLTIDEAIVRWTSDREFGVELTSLSPDAAARFSDYLTAHLSADAHGPDYAVSPFS